MYILGLIRMNDESLFIQHHTSELMYGHTYMYADSIGSDWECIFIMNRAEWCIHAVYNIRTYVVCYTGSGWRVYNIMIQA